MHRRADKREADATKRESDAAKSERGAVQSPRCRACGVRARATNAAHTSERGAVQSPGGGMQSLWGARTCQQCGACTAEHGMQSGAWHAVRVPPRDDGLGGRRRRAAAERLERVA